MKKILRFNLRYKRVFLRLLLVGVLTAVQPWLWGTINDTAVAAHRQQSQQQQLAALRLRVDQIKQSTVSPEDFLDQLTAVVPAAASLPQVVERLERLSVDQQTQLEILNISDVNPGDEAALVPIKATRVTIQVRGRAEYLLAVMDRIEHVQEIAIIEQWSLNPATVQLVPSPQPGEHLYSLIAQVLFFFQEDANAN